MKCEIVFWRAPLCGWILCPNVLLRDTCLAGKTSQSLYNANKIPLGLLYYALKFASCDEFNDNTNFIHINSSNVLLSSFPLQLIDYNMNKETAIIFSYAQRYIGILRVRR